MIQSKKNIYPITYKVLSKYMKVPESAWKADLIDPEELF